MIRQKVTEVVFNEVIKLRYISDEYATYIPKKKSDDYGILIILIKGVRKGMTCHGKEIKGEKKSRVIEIRNRS
jgi:hypothetical protein